MSKIFYYVVLKPLSFLPLSILYFLSDIIFFFVYHVTGYRKSVVQMNLKNSFPKKSQQEIDVIQREFYTHLCDLIVESIRLFSMPLDEMKKRFKINNTDILEKFHKQGRSVILVGGHYNNWEIAAMGFDTGTPHQAIGIYSPLSDKFFEKMLGESRSKYGVEIVKKAMVARSFVTNKKKLTMTIFGADQSPTYAKQVHWTNFLNQETAVHIGTEIFAIKYNYPVVFIKINKVKRGHFEGELEVLSEYPSTTGVGVISELHTKCLEKIIVENPSYWLWSHKRWKRKKTPEERLLEVELKPNAA